MRCDPGLIQDVERTAASFAAAHVAERTAEIDHEAPGLAAEVFQQGVEAGFDRLLLPETAGGVGFGRPELCGLIGALARTCAGQAMVFGVHAAAVSVLQPLVSAERLERLLTERGHPIGLALPAPATLTTFDTDLVVSKSDGSTLRLGGDPGTAFNWIPGGHLLTFARTDAGDRAALLVSTSSVAGANQDMPASPLGLRAMPITEPALTGVTLRADEALLATGEKAGMLHQTLLGELSLVSGAAAAGVMQAAHRQALAYAAERYQGGKMIADHTHVRSILGGMSATVVAATGAVRHAAELDREPQAALAAKLAATSGAMQVCTDAVQVLGGYGYMREFGVEKMLRDAAVLALLPVSNARVELLLAARDRDLLT